MEGLIVLLQRRTPKRDRPNAADNAIAWLVRYDEQARKLQSLAIPKSSLQKTRWRVRTPDAFMGNDLDLLLVSRCMLYKSKQDIWLA
jgi:hypothetical protein